MFNFFNRPYNQVERSGDKIISILVFGLFIFLFLFLFKPFGLSELATKLQFFVTLGFGLVTSFVLLIFRYLLEPAVSGKNWTLGKNILWDIFTACSIGVANYFYIRLVFHQPFIPMYLLFAVWTAILVGSIPVTIGYIVNFNRIYRNALKQASIPAEDVFWEDEVILRAGNQKNELKFNPRNIIYLCSNDNYITIVAMKGELVSKTTVRGTLKSAESELRRNKRFFRCHKCYIVNLDFAQSITGNNQNMTIRLINTPAEIPVSRTKANMVQNLLKRN